VIFFTLAVTTLIPAVADENLTIDLDAIYFSSSRSVFFLLAVHEATALAADYLPGVIDAPPALFMVAMILIFLFGMSTKRKDIHFFLLSSVIGSQTIPFVVHLF
jgi:hypothetical protein